MNELILHFKSVLSDFEIQMILVLIVYMFLVIAKWVLETESKTYYFCYCFNSKFYGNAFAIIPLLLSAVMIRVCAERINEIKKGEEDDISKY